MPDRSRKPTDLNSLAARIVGEATSEPEDEEKVTFSLEPEPPKNPAAQALGRLGGLKGGKARAAALTPEERKRIAQGAARSRWGQTKNVEIE